MVPTTSSEAPSREVDGLRGIANRESTNKAVLEIHGTGIEWHGERGETSNRRFF